MVGREIYMDTHRTIDRLRTSRTHYLVLVLPGSRTYTVEVRSIRDGRQQWMSSYRSSVLFRVYNMSPWSVI